MEQLKRFFKKIWIKGAGQKMEVTFDRVITVENGRAEIKRTPVKVERKKTYKYTLLMDILFCWFVCLLWASVFSFSVRFLTGSNNDKGFQEYLFISCFIIVSIMSASNTHFESLFVKGLEKSSPKVAIVVKKNPVKKMYILRMRLRGTKEFIETEIEDSKLTYDEVLDVCCKELKVEKEKVTRFLKVPETTIRDEADIKRFRIIEYLELEV